MNNDFQTEFFMSQIHYIRDIRENEKIKISLVYYEGIQGPCVLKICKNRDLSDVCAKLMEIRHPNVAVVYDYLYTSGNTYIIEEFMDGSTLHKHISENGVFKEKDTSKIIIDVCKGLEVLHSQRPPIVHNDINTANIMVKEDGSVKVFDFDIARIYKTGSGKNTRLLGTEEYAAPEHYGYGQSEPRTDIYSLGITMHEMLTGEQLTKEHKMTYKRKLKKVIKKCIEVDPRKRYLSAKQLRKDLERKSGIVVKLLKGLLSVVLVMLLLITIDIFKDNSAVEEEQLNTFVVSEEQEVNINDSIPNSYIEENEKAQKQIEPVSAGISQVETSSISNDDVEQEKIMENIYTIKGELRKIVGKNDGSFVIYEIIGAEGYLRTSTGESKKIEGIGTNNELMYNGNTDTLYLISRVGDIYEVDNSLNITLVGQCRRNGTEERYAYYRFFSDGMLLSNAFYDGDLIDSSTWTCIGGGPRVDAVINDSPYILLWEEETIYAISEIDFQGNEIKKYDIADKPNCYVTESEKYSSQDALYLIGTKEEKEYVYRFDGEKWDIIVCLNDYKYYSKTYSNNFAVTQDAVWLYDRNTKIIKEFKLN